MPTDFSPHAQQALPFAREMAAAHDAEILLCHVMEPPIYPTMLEGTALVMPPLDESLRDQLHKQLEALRDQEFEGMRARVVLREGSPTTELLEVAAEEDVDLIVVATHGYTGLKHMLLGSTAERIVRMAPCPVLTVREKTNQATES